MDITIKETKHFEEADAIAKSSHDYFETGFEQLIKDVRSHILYGAFIGEKMVGFITYKIVSEGVVEISWLAVAPECRQKGIGTKLVTDTLKILKKSKFIQRALFLLYNIQILFLQLYMHLQQLLWLSLLHQ